MKDREGGEEREVEERKRGGRWEVDGWTTTGGKNIRGSSQKHRSHKTRKILCYFNIMH